MEGWHSARGLGFGLGLLAGTAGFGIGGGVDVIALVVISNRFNILLKRIDDIGRRWDVLGIKFWIDVFNWQLLITKRDHLNSAYKTPFDIRPPLEDVKMLVQATSGGLICQLIR